MSSYVCCFDCLMFLQHKSKCQIQVFRHLARHPVMTHQWMRLTKWYVCIYMCIYAPPPHHPQIPSFFLSCPCSLESILPAMISKSFTVRKYIAWYSFKILLLYESILPGMNSKLFTIRKSSGRSAGRSPVGHRSVAGRSPVGRRSVAGRSPVGRGSVGGWSAVGLI